MRLVLRGVLGCLLMSVGCASTAVTERTPYADAFGTPGNRLVITRAPVIVPARFLWPVSPVVVTSGFGFRAHPLFGETAQHAGVDLATEMAQPVYAAFDGTVEFSGWHGGYGNQVVVKHDAHWRSTYSHLDTRMVKAGQKVSRGALLGLAGSTGDSTGVHLHFEVHRDGVALDPEQMLAVRR